MTRARLLLCLVFPDPYLFFEASSFTLSCRACICSHMLSSSDVILLSWCAISSSSSDSRSSSRFFDVCLHVLDLALNHTHVSS